MTTSGSLVTGDLLNAYKVLEVELGHAPAAPDLDLLRKVYSVFFGAAGAFRRAEKTITTEQLNTLALSLDELDMLTDLVELGHIQPGSILKVANSMLVGQKEEANEQQVIMANKAWNTVLCWLEGKSLQSRPRDATQKHTLVADDEKGNSVRSLSGGLPSLGRR